MAHTKPIEYTLTRWQLTGRVDIRWRDVVALIFGRRLYIRFVSPNGECHAACELQSFVQREWPADADQGRLI